MKTILVLAPHPELAEAIRTSLDPQQYHILHRSGFEEAERGELRRAREHHKARRARLDDRETRLTREHAVRRADEDAREEDGPALRERGARRAQRTNGRSGGTLR